MITTRYHAGSMALLAVTLAGSAVAAPAPQATTSGQVERLLACRAIADSAARLICLDRETGLLADAIGRKELMMVDRGTMRATKTRLFGFAVPTIGLFGKDDREDIKELSSTLTAATPTGDGYSFILADGSRWRQIDTKELFGEPKRGAKVVVRRVSLGSYILEIEGQNAVKVRRTS